MQGVQWWSNGWSATPWNLLDAGGEEEEDVGVLAELLDQELGINERTLYLEVLT